jgi:hypothetical protein
LELRRGDADGWMLYHRVHLDAEMRMATALALHHACMRRCGCRVGFYRADKVGKRKQNKTKQNKTKQNK